MLEQSCPTQRVRLCQLCSLDDHSFPNDEYISIGEYCAYLACPRNLHVRRLDLGGDGGRVHGRDDGIQFRVRRICRAHRNRYDEI